MSAPAIDFAEVQRAEGKWLAARRAAAGLPPPDHDVVGLAFSGGGIRSAVFNLGVLQALEAGGLMARIDYLSSVSGGGYIASCYSWLRAALPAGADRVFETPLRDRSGNALDWIRSHGKYLTSHRGFSIWTLLASILASTFVNVLVLGPALLFAVFALTLAWLPVQWQAWLALPGAALPSAHHGFLLLLGGGAACLLLFPLIAVVFAFVAGIPNLATVRRIDRMRVLMGRLLVYGLALLALGLIPVVGALGEMLQHTLSMPQGQAVGKHASYLLPMLSGLASMLADKLRGGAGRGRLATIGVSLLVYGLLILAYHLATSTTVVGSIGFAATVALSVLLAFACDINRVSIHAYYRARLSDAFLPPVRGAACEDPGNFGLAQMGPEQGAPLQLVNTTLNMSSSRNERDRSRMGASFFFSPVSSGSQATGFRLIADYAGGAMALSTAFTVSGAAIDPDIAAVDSRPVSFMMALLNVRLGFWARNPAHGDAGNPPLPWWWIFIGREMLGVGLDARHRHVHLSDGGGFENLGIYELIRRRARYIIACDAGSDPQTTLADLGRAIERVRVDFGAEIDLDADRLYHERSQVLEQRPFVFGSVRYADGSRGEILYIKPMLCAGLSADIYAYWRANPSFPDESTAEQFFAEPQFEAYRALGQQIVARLVGGVAPDSVGAWFEQVKATGS